MVSAKTVEIVKETAPILAEKGEVVTARFYQNMFTDHPELLNMFNHANQRQGKQQASLAQTVYAASQHIDELDVLLPAVKQIAHKHRSLGVKREHYPIVGSHLLRAMKEVLGEVATSDVLTAWEEAYGAIAKVFIGVEATMYEEAAAAHGGWCGLKDFIVVQKMIESTEISSFYLQPCDGGEMPDYLPGQYVTIRVHPPGEVYAHNRQYSLSTAPGGVYLRISVKRESECTPKGVVSNFLHEQVDVGDRLQVSAPAGAFTLNVSQRKPAILISGGVGVTPLLSMLHTIALENLPRPVTFIQAAKNADVCAFRSEVEDCLGKQLIGKGYHCFGDAQSVRSQIEEILRQVVEKTSEVYMCGPVGFMKTVITLLKSFGVNEADIHYECFGPAVLLQ